MYRTEETRRRLRRAYVLILVLGIATIVASLGIAFIESNGSAMPQAHNRMYAMGAEYLAESGVDVAKHYLLYPPTTVPLNDFWHGGSNIAVDATSDTTDVQVTPHASHRDRYYIAASGVARGTDGSVKAKKGVHAEVIVPRAHIWEFSQALICKTTVTLPAPVHITGNVHGNGHLTSLLGWCNGHVTASGTALWIGGGPPASTTSLAPAIAVPSASITPYSNYTIRGTVYTAYFYSGSSMNVAQAAALNAIDMSATNPGRVIRVTAGDFRIKNSVSLNGTLLVAGGKLEVEQNVSITAVAGFPAIVATGNVEFKDNDAAAGIAGPVICGADIDMQNKANLTVNLNGTVILTGQVAGGGGILARANFAWSAARSWLYNFETTPERRPITVLSWKEQ